MTSGFVDFTIEIKRAGIMPVGELFRLLLICGAQIDVATFKDLIPRGPSDTPHIHALVAWPYYEATLRVQVLDEYIDFLTERIGKMGQNIKVAV